MFALDPVALDRAGARLTSAVSGLSCLDVAGPLRSLTRALPDSATAAAGEWTATDVSAALDAWVQQLLQLAETAALVARDAELADLDVASSLRPAEP